MFTANSMNCLTEALGLALPGNGTLLATHARREALFRRPGRRIVGSDAPATTTRATRPCCRGPSRHRAAFENAMALDIAMGGSTNTVLHSSPPPTRAACDFTMGDIDRLSRRVPHLCKVAPATEHATTWRTCTAPAASSPSWASSTAPG